MHIIVDHVLFDSLYKLLLGCTAIEILVYLFECVFSDEASDSCLDAELLEDLIKEAT